MPTTMGPTTATTTRPRLTFLPVLSLLCAILMSGVLVTWRRLETSTVTSGRHLSSHRHRHHPHLYESQAYDGDLAGIQPYKTLVLYVYHEGDEITMENLAFFLKAGIGDVEDPVVDYVIIVNGEATVDLEGLPLNVRVVRRPNTCYDGGSAGEVLASMDIRLYQFFFIMNSSVRGPFLPAYFTRSNGGGLGPGSSLHLAGRPWTTAFTDLLNDRVKLVGTTISCEILIHVQSMVLATDRVGLEVLWKTGTLDCAGDREDAIANYELGASARIMEHGYSIDCLMLRYQGVDWRAHRPVACNERRNPFLGFNYDGMPTMNPLELVFVKVKPHVLASDHVLQRWTDYELGRDDLTSSHLYSPAVQSLLTGRRERLTSMVADCGATFDYSGFVAEHPSLDQGSPEATYEAFLEDHLFNGTTYRYTVPESDEDQVTHDHCRSFVKFGAADLSN